jgi:hypothetical protein
LQMAHQHGFQHYVSSGVVIFSSFFFTKLLARDALHIHRSVNHVAASTL